MNINRYYIIYLNLDEKTKDKKEAKYYNLLTEQLFWVNRNDVKVFKRSKNLYDKYKAKSLNKYFKSIFFILDFKYNYIQG